MSNLHFDSSDLMAMRSFYENELDNTLKKLHHIQNVLQKLNSPAAFSATPVAATKVTASEAAPKKRGRKPKGYVPTIDGNAQLTSAAAAKTTRKKGKAGRSSIWGKYILQHLTKTDKPLTYNELFEAAKKDNNIPKDPAKEKSVHQAVINASHRLRNTNKKIDTFALKGSRIKFVALKSWFEPNGNIKAEYLNKVS